MNLKKNTIHLVTDGSSTIAKGIAGIGVILYYNGYEKTYSEFIGNKTNNYAELFSIKFGLEKCKRKDIPVYVYSDSQYAIGVLTKNWKPKKNVKLISETKELMNEFKEIKFEWVKGHSDNVFNQRVDNLAKEGSYKK